MEQINVNVTLSSLHSSVLTSNDLDLMRVIPKRYQNATATGILRHADQDVVVDGNFTIFMFRERGGKGVAVGTSKRNPTDPQDFERARRIAAIRAYRQFDFLGWL